MKRLAVGWLASKCSQTVEAVTYVGNRRFCNYSKSSESDIFMDTSEQSSQGIGTTPWRTNNGVAPKFWETLISVYFLQSFQWLDMQSYFKSKIHNVFLKEIKKHNTWYLFLQNFQLVLCHDDPSRENCAETKWPRKDFAKLIWHDHQNPKIWRKKICDFS